MDDVRSTQLPATFLVALAALLPLVVCLLLSATDLLENTNAALVLVLVVVAAAATGSRAVGLTAAGVSAAGFDYFLTEPYYQFRINDRSDIETAVLLLLIGAAVTEIALWGRRQQAAASEQRGYLDGLLEATQAVAASLPPATVLDHISTQLVDLLDLDTASFVAEIADDPPTLQADGTVVQRGHRLDVDRTGWPTDTEVVVPVFDDGVLAGGFRLVAATHVARPSAERRRVAAAMAGQAGRAIARNPPGHQPSAEA
jgi:K+-sensing histidine kinase KdpD